MAKRIGARDIEARLGLTMGDGAPPPKPPSEGGAGGVVLFSFVGVALAIGAAAFLTFGGGVDGVMANLSPAPPFASRVAAQCDAGWKIDRVNSEQIHCYMAHDLARLCDPRERQALADKWREFQTAADRAEARVGASAIAMAYNPGVMSLGMEEARGHDPRMTAEQQIEHEGKMFGMADKLMAPAMEAVADTVYNVKKADLVMDVRTLIQRGYLSSADFSWTTPKLVQQALDAADKVTPACR